MKNGDRPKALTVATLRTDPHGVASPCIAKIGQEKLARPEGLEPPTLGSEDRCSIQLSYGRKSVPRPCDAAADVSISRRHRTPAEQRTSHCGALASSRQPSAGQQ